MPQKARKWPKFEQTYQKLFRNFQNFRLLTHFRLLVHIKNVRKKLSFYFHQSSKLLPERMTLVEMF